MKKIFLVMALLFAGAVDALAQTNCVRLTEADGSPNAPCVNKITVTNGTLVCATTNQCTLTTGGGGGSPGGSNTQLQYNNAGAFGGITGATSNGTIVTLTSPVLITPALGTPASGVMTNVTGLPIATGVSGLGTGVATFLATPSSANLATAVTGETGSGALVFATSPALVTPDIGTPSAGVLTNATGLPISTGLTGAGTGVLTALGVNVGSAGAFITFNGALGTPSSGTLTNATGLPPTTGIVGWPANASGCLSNNGSGTLSWAACSGGGGSQTPWTSNIDADGFNLLFDDSTGIKSSESGNANLLLFTSAASGVNYFNLRNSATATTPVNILEALGTDSNVSIHLKAKTGTYPNNGQVFFNASARYDRPSIAFYDENSTTYIPTVGIGMKSGGSWLSLTAPNIMLGAGDGTPGYIGITGNSYLAWNVNNTAAEDCPACVAVGLNKPAQRVIGVVGADSTPDGDLTHGATFGFIANTPAQITSNQDNYDPGDASYFQRWSSDASRNVTGLTFAISTKVSGQIHRIWNVGSFNIVLVNDATSTAANRFLTSTGADITLATKECADVQYDATQSRWLTTPCATAGGGSGTVTSVAQSFTGGLISVGGSPVTTSGTLALTVAGTSGGIPYFSSASTWASSAALSANLPVIGGGAGAAPSVGTVSGNTTKFVTTTGTLTSGRCAEWDASGNLIEASAACGGGGGSPGGSSGDVQFNNAGSFGGTNLTYSSPTLTQTVTSLGATRTDGLVLTNTTAAAAGTTQFSQALRFSSQGWKTTATAASRTVEFNLDLRPIEQTTNPAYTLQLSTQCASCTTGTSFSQHSVFGVAVDGTQYTWFPGGLETGWPGIAIGPNFGTQASPTINGIFANAGGGWMVARPANNFGAHGGGMTILSGGCFQFNNNSSSIPTGTNDAFICRGGAAATIRLGQANAASPVAQKLITQGSRGGTDSNVAGANLTIVSGLGTGNATPSQLRLSSPLIGSTGTTAQTETIGLTIINGTARLSVYTVATLPGASTSGEGAMAFVTDATSTTTYTTVAGGGSNKVMVISDGTNWIIH